MTKRKPIHAKEDHAGRELLASHPGPVQAERSIEREAAPAPLADETLRLTGELLGAVESYVGANARQGAARFVVMVEAAKALRAHLSATA